ncbi:MAG: helix-turn-helix transcriptional regulator [Burkholderiales bacterium]|nr:helix-turn-helix domain-containing protein [Burkholderiales bacterium]MDE2159178.1 helix-turn-helix transcriptional regulator [Burkholderiales bacterium]
MAVAFETARELIAARSRAGLTQAEVAMRMGTAQSAIARPERGKRPPSLRTAVLGPAGIRPGRLAAPFRCHFLHPASPGVSH